MPRVILLLFMNVYYYVSKKSPEVVPTFGIVFFLQRRLNIYRVNVSTRFTGNLSERYR